MVFKFSKTGAVFKRWSKSWSGRIKATSINGIALLVLVNIGPGVGATVATPGEQYEPMIRVTSVVKTKGVEAGGSRLPVVVTAYSSDVDQTDDTPFITASGERVRDGIVAANFLPMGTKIKIPKLFGEKIFVVKDRMAKRFTDRVDVWFNDRSSAIKFGLRKAEIVVL